MKQKLFYTILLLSFTTFVAGQTTTDSSLSLKHPDKYIDAVADKAKSIEQKLNKKSEKALAQLKKEEDKIIQKIAKADSVLGKQLREEAVTRYKALEEKLKNPGKFSQYLPRLDSLSTSLNFLQNSPLIQKTKELQDKLKDAVSKMDALKSQLQKAENIKQFMRERKQFLKDQLSKFGFSKELKKLNKQAYYYSQLVKDYKEILSDPKKLEKHALAILSKIPAFQRFMEKNSMLASIFGFSGGSSAGSISLVGLQSRASVQQTIRSSVIGNNGNAPQFISQQLQTANSQLGELRNKIAFIDLSGNAEPAPNFKPNTQKTKSLFKRLEFGSNIQFGNTNRLLPTTGDFAVTVGFKLNDKSVIGIGSSYKLGIGTRNRIQLSNQGFGLRSYIDWKVRGGFYLSGGYERNYLAGMPLSFNNQSLNRWQESGLLGAGKKVNVSKNKKLTLQVLFDFLSYKNKPQSQPFIFRTGWAF